MPLLLAVVMGLGAGFAGGFLATDIMKKIDGEHLIASLFAVLIAALVAGWLQVVLHEAGHLVGGLLSGYRFVSFRVGNLVILRQQGHLQLRRMAMAGTGGQCLMAPPEPYDPKMPTQLYNYGGVLMNLLVSLLAGLGALAVGGLFQVFLVMLALLGVFFAGLNGVPMGSGPVANDGSNARHLKRDEGSVKAFWVQLKVQEELLNGNRLKDMPGEWFETESKISNMLLGAQAAMRAEREMDEGRFEKAEETLLALMRDEETMGGLLTFSIKVQLVYLRLTGDTPDVEGAQRLMDKNYRKFQRQMMKHPTILRTLYTVRLIADRDIKGAEEAMTRFELAARKHPYPCEIQMERELLARANHAAEKLGITPPAVSY